MAWNYVGRVLTIVLVTLQVLGTTPLLFTSNLAKVNATQTKQPRRLLEVFSGEPLLPPGDPLNQCLGIGPLCPEGGVVECNVGGIVGCMCGFVRDCEPAVSDCYFKDSKGAYSFCGF